MRIGIAALRASGAVVAAKSSAARSLRSGTGLATVIAVQAWRNYQRIGRYGTSYVGPALRRELNRLRSALGAV